MKAIFGVVLLWVSSCIAIENGILTSQNMLLVVTLFCLLLVAIKLFFKSSASSMSDSESASGLHYLDYTVQELIDFVCSEIHDNLKAIISEHFSALSRNRLLLITEDSYGIVNDEKWRSEIEYFSKHKIIPKLPRLMEEQAKITQNYINNKKLSPEEKTRLSSFETPDLFEFINNYLDYKEANQEVITNKEQVDNMDPYEFESYCAERLRQAGFKAKVTQGSGDQGVDVKAEKNGKVWVIQCKLYSKPVGNKAVQEVIAGRAYECADKAAVVTNNTYTNSAIELAKTTDVMLLHYMDLDELD